MPTYRSLSKLLPALLVAAAACAQTAVTPPGLTLAQAIDQAVKNNLQTKIAQERANESRAQRGIGLSALLPNISGVAYQMSLTENLAAQGLSASTFHFPGLPAFIGPFDRFDARFEMVQSLFNLAAIRRYQATRYGVQLAEQQRRLAEEQLTTGTALAYIAVLAAGQSVAAAEANVQLARQLLDLAVNQRNAGIATGLDVARAETRLASQQVQLAQARTNLDTARLNLLRVIGSPLSARVLPLDEMRFQPQPPPAAGEAVGQALADRLELRVASEQLRIAEVERKAAIGGWAPAVSAFGDYGSSGLKPNEVDLPTRSIGIRIDVPIFDGGRTRAEVQAATSRVRPAEMQLSELRAAVEKDVRQALDNLATREEQMRAAQQNLDLAQRELSLAQDRFRNGVNDARFAYGLRRWSSRPARIWNESSLTKLRAQQSQWQKLGRSGPLWAILTAPAHRHGGWTPEEFFAPGALEIDEVMVRAASFGLPEPRSAALDFGSGVGRATQALAVHFERVTGVDIAPVMIEQAQR